MIFFLLLFSLSASAQVIESRAVALKGTSLPGTCVVGERFVKTDAPRALQLHICTATNTWSPVGYLVAGASGALIVDTGVYPHTVDVDTAVVCRTTATCAPTGSFDLSGAAATRSMKSGTTPPGTCAVGELFYDTDAAAGRNIYGCTSTNTWTLQGDGGGGSVSQSTALVRGPMDIPLYVNGSQFAFTANRVYCGNFFAPHDISVGHMVAWQVIGIGAGDLRFGIYDSGGSLLSSSGAPTSSGNTLNATITQSLTGGTTYSLCVATNDSAIRMSKILQGQNEEGLYNLNETNFFYCQNTMSGTTLPSSCGTKTAINTGGFPWFGIAK